LTRCIPRFNRVAVRVALLPTVARALLVTRTHRRPDFRSTLIVTVAARLVETVTVAERLFTLGDTVAICAIGQPSFEIAYSVGHASSESIRLSPSTLLGGGGGGGGGQPLADVP
jgi:hypothetical protein